MSNHEAGISAAVSACELPRKTVEKVVEAYQSARGDGWQPMTNNEMIEAVARAIGCVKHPNETIEDKAWRAIQAMQHIQAYDPRNAELEEQLKQCHAIATQSFNFLILHWEEDGELIADEIQPQLRRIMDIAKQALTHNAKGVCCDTCTG